MYDPFAYQHNDQQNLKSYIRGSNRIDFLFCTYNILKVVTQWGITAFNELTVSYLYGLFIDIKKDKVTKDNTIEEPSLFLQKTTIQFPKALKQYKK